MATLTGNTIASTYTGLLSVTGAVGADTVEAVTDGAGTSTSLSLSQQRATITLGSGAADDFIVDGTTFVVEGDNKEIRLVVSDTGNVSSDIFSIKVGETDKTFRMVFKTENLTKVMEGSYDIELSSKRISHFKRKSDSLEYWIALEQNSTYEE